MKVITRCSTVVNIVPEYTDLILCINTNPNLENVCIKFSDLQEDIRKVNLTKVCNLQITNIPSYRDPRFEDYVARYVFNKAGIQEAITNNNQYANLIFGEGE